MQRIRELTVQAKNGTNSASDRLYQERDHHPSEEIGRVAETTNFNGVKVFDGSKEKITIQIGDKDEDTIDIKLSKLDMETLGLDKFMDDFADIGITMNGAGTAASQYDKAADVKAVGVDTGLDTDVTGKSWKVNTDDAAKLATAIGGGATGANMEVYVHPDTDEAFVHNKADGKVYKLDIASMEFEDDGATNAKIKTVANGNLTEMDPADADMLVNGPSTLSNAKQMTAADTFKDKAAQILTLTKTSWMIFQKPCLTMRTQPPPG